MSEDSDEENDSDANSNKSNKGENEDDEDFHFNDRESFPQSPAAGLSKKSKASNVGVKKKLLTKQKSFNYREE